MSYNNIFLCGLLLLLTGCAATTPVQTKSEPQPSNKQNEVDKDIATYALAITDMKNGDLDSARALLKRLSGKHPDLAGPWANLALIDIKEKHLGKAKIDLQKAIKSDPTMPQAYNMMGYIDKQQGKIMLAIKEYQQSIALKPDYAMAHYNLALLYDIYLQNVPKAVAHYKRYLALTDDKDQRTVDWVKELESSMKQGGQ